MIDLFISYTNFRHAHNMLILDDRVEVEREDVTYTDGIQSADGTIRIVYDHQRTPLGEVLMATFREEDARVGKSVSDKVQLRALIDRLPQANQQAEKES